MSAEKFRPYLSGSQILHILATYKSKPIFTDEDLDIIATLGVYAGKINNGALKTAYVAKDNQSIEAKLGLPEKFADTKTPEQKRFDAFKRWEANPASVSIAEMDLVQTYRYEEGLMTEEEKEAYEIEMNDMSKFLAIQEQAQKGN